MATSLLSSRGSTSYVSLAFSRVPKQGDKIRSGCLTLSFSEAHKCAELLQNPSILGGPPKEGQKQKWLPPPFLPAGPQTTQAVHFGGSPNKGTI